jgi:hypothetical protein
MASEKPRVDDCRTGVGTDVALPGPCRSNDRIVDFTGYVDRDNHKSDAVLLVRSLMASKSESQIVMNGQSQELPSSPSPLSLQPILGPEDERSVHK